jgi:hypothetical protein
LRAPTPHDQSAQVGLWDDLDHYVHANHIRGLAGGAFTKDHRTVEVYWAGAVPQGLIGVASRHHEGAAMVIKPVPYDQDQIGVRARGMIAAAKTQGYR